MTVITETFMLSTANWQRAWVAINQSTTQLLSSVAHTVIEKEARSTVRNLNSRFTELRIAHSKDLKTTQFLLGMKKIIQAAAKEFKEFSILPPESPKSLSKIVKITETFYVNEEHLIKDVKDAAESIFAEYVTKKDAASLLGHFILLMRAFESQHLELQLFIIEMQTETAAKMGLVSVLF